MPAGTRTCPGLKVVAPWSAADAKGLLKAAIRDPTRSIFLENEMLYGQSFDVPEDRRTSSCRSARPRSCARARTSPSSPISHHGRHGAGGGRDAGRGGHRGRGDRPAHHAPARHRDHRRSRSRRPTAWSRSRRAGRSPASASEIAAQMMEHAFDYLDAPAGARLPARTCRCPMPPISRSWRCRRLATSWRRPRPSATAKAPDGEGSMPINILMPALSPTMTEGNARHVAQEGGRHGQVRRRDRRDRDRQGDHGGRGGRRGHASARSWCPKAPRA